MDDMESIIRRVVREEIARAFQAVDNVAMTAMSDTSVTGVEITALAAIRRTVHRVAADVLADTHPVLDTGHTRVHTITSVSERPSFYVCTCQGHSHLKGNGDACGYLACFCPTPVRAQSEHAECTPGRCVLGVRSTCPVTHAQFGPSNPGCGHRPCDGWAICRSTDRPADEPKHTCTPPDLDDLRAGRVCSLCLHVAHASGDCGEHVYRRGVAVACPCIGGPRAALMCSVCKHAPHMSGGCDHVEHVQGHAFSCGCTGVQA